MKLKPAARKNIYLTAMIVSLPVFAWGMAATVNFGTAKTDWRAYAALHKSITSQNKITGMAQGQLLRKRRNQ